MTELSLTKYTSRCRLCGVEKAQIDTSLDHARKVVTAAMDDHIREAHPCSCGDRTRPNINHRVRVPCWTYSGKERYDVRRDGTIASGRADG